MRSNPEQRRQHAQWLQQFIDTYGGIVPAVCETHHRCSANVLCGFMSLTVEDLSAGRLAAVCGILVARQYEGQSPEEGAYMPHLWCVDRYRRIVDFAPFAQGSTDFLLDYVTEKRRPDEYAELSQLIIQPQNQTVCQWHEEFETLRQTEKFRDTIKDHVAACREIAVAAIQWGGAA